MADPRIEKLADVLIDYSLAIREGDFFVINSPPVAAPLVEALYVRALKKGAFPVTSIALPHLSELFLTHATTAQLEWVSPLQRLVIERADATFSILADTNTKALTNTDPTKQMRRAAAMNDLSKTYMERAASGALRWSLTQYPTEAHAQDAEMSLAEYEAFVFGAGLLDEPDPVAAWKKQGAEQQRLIDWLVGKEHVHIVGPDTDLTLSIKDRVFINADGTRNFPDGEIFTGPVEESINGHIHFSYPANLGGREIEDIRLTFEHGVVTQATAARGQDYLEKMLDTDAGARRVGEFAFGTNYGIQRFTKNTLFDEKIGGTIHMALGRAYPETGGTNESAIHTDIVCDLREGGTITVDGQTFARDGKFVI
ncbi:MAG: aminopeptidase [Thermomicrobiales bacterium]